MFSADGPRENVFPDLVVALDVPVAAEKQIHPQFLSETETKILNKTLIKTTSHRLKSYNKLILSASTADSQAADTRRPVLYES